MKKFRKLRGVKRSMFAATLIVGLVGSGAYAVLQSQQNTLTGNTITTATAGLQLSLNGINYANTQPGFNFNDVVPGGEAMPVEGYEFRLRNTGSASLNVRLAAGGQINNPSSIDLRKVKVLVTTVGSGQQASVFTLQELMDGNPAISPGPLLAGATQQYKLQIAMEPDAVEGAGTSISSVDFVFTGIAG